MAIRHLWRWLNRQSGKIWLLGLLGLIVYNWRAWQRDKQWLRRQPQGTEPPRLQCTPLVSALVAAWNEEELIEAHLQSFLALTYPQIELILCAGGTDHTLEIARRYAGPRIKVLEQHSGEGKQAALARCLPLAEGEIIFLTDADCLYNDTALAHLLAPLINEGEQVVSGASRPLDEQLNRVIPANLWATATVASRHNPGHFKGLLGRNAALWRSALEKAGGLDFVARSGTDYQLAKRLLAADLAIRHVPFSVVASRYPQRPGEYRRQQVRWLRNLLYYGPHYGDTENFRAALKTVTLGNFLLALPCLALLIGPLVLVGWGWLVAQAVLARWRYLSSAARLNQQSLLPKLLAGAVPVVLLDFVTWAQPAFDLLVKSRRERW